MSATLSITTLQISLTWNDPKSNRNYIENYLNTLKNTDIVIVPETFTTGFAVENFDPESMNGETINWMQKMAQKFQIGIIGSLLITEKGKVYNRMIFTTPDGPIQYYNKWHLFSMGNEGKLLTKGNKLPLFEYKNWKIKPLICYDLRFPVTTRNVENYDLIVCIANWPKARIEAWDTLLKARAIENLCYIAGVNRVGTDANSIEYPGHSNIYDPTGKALYNLHKTEQLQTTVIEKEKIKTTRTTFPFLTDRDSFIIQ